MNVDMNLMTKNIIKNEKRIMISLNVSVRNQYNIAYEDCTWNLRICPCECYKDCKIYDYLKDYTCTKSLDDDDDDVLVTYDEILDTSETALSNPNDKTNYWHIAVALLAIMCLLWLVVIVVKYLLHERRINDSMFIIILMS